MLLTLHYRLLASYLLLVTIAIAVVSIYLLAGFRRFFLGLAREDLQERATYVAATLTREGGVASRKRVAEATKRFRDHSVLTLRVMDAAGHLVASSRAQDRPGISMRTLPGVYTALNGRLASSIVRADQAMSERLYVAVPIWHPSRRKGSPVGVVRLSLLLRDVNAALARLEITVALGLLLAFGLCAVFSALLARSISAPLRRMSGLAEQVRRGRFGEEVRIGTRDDLGRLGEALNAMSRRLAEQEAERSAFLAAASHELRTPVSNIQAALEALSAGGDALPERRAQLLQGAIGEGTRLGRLIQELVDLGYLESGAVSMEAQPVDLRRLIEQALSAAGPRMEDKRLRARTILQGEAVVVGDACRLQQVLLNLIDNAVRHSPPGGELQVVVEEQPRRVRLCVADEGPGICPAALPRIFDRFFTTNTSRSRQHGGAGLGLYIVKRIVEAHGGEVTAENAWGGGARVILTLPRAQRRSEAGKELAGESLDNS